jgi:hypothetical protein
MNDQNRDQLVHYNFEGDVPLKVMHLAMWLLNQTEEIPNLVDMTSIDRIYALMIVEFTMKTQLVGGLVQAKTAHRKTR